MDLKLILNSLVSLHSYITLGLEILDLLAESHVHCVGGHTGPFLAVLLSHLIVCSFLLIKSL